MQASSTVRSPSIRPRRSALFMPGSNPRALDKARSLPADCVIFDLEDAVAPGAKAMARDQIVAAVAAGGYGNRELVIRVNGLDTDWGDGDIAAAATAGADAVLFPKVESAEALKASADRLRAAGAPATMAVWAMAETPRGVANIASIAAADPSLAVIVMGTSDLGTAMRIPVTPGRLGLLPLLSACLLAARAQGLDILDGVFGDLADERGFKKACEQGKSLGFDGKTLIHPKQIDTANRIFGVTDAECAEAETIIAAWEAAASEGRGIAVVNGRMVENLHADDARRVLALRAAIEAKEE